MGVLLLLVELLAEAGGEHLVDSQVGQEEVVVVQQLLLVLELLIFFLKFCEPNDFGDTWDLEVFNLSLELTGWVFHEHTCSGMILRIIKWVWHFDLNGLGGWVQGHLVQGECHVDEVFVFLEQLLSQAVGLGLLGVLLEGLHRLDDLLPLQCLLQLGIDLLGGLGEELGVEFLLLDGGAVGVIDNVRGASGTLGFVLGRSGCSDGVFGVGRVLYFLAHI